MNDSDFVLALAHALPVVLVRLLMKEGWMHATGWAMMGVGLFGLIVPPGNASAAAFVFALFGYGGTWGTVSLIEDLQERQAARKEAERHRAEREKAFEEYIARKEAELHRAGRPTIVRVADPNIKERRAVGQRAENRSAYKQALPNGTKLRGYRFDDVLGAGGFGITYRGVHESLGSVAIKEYFPNELAVRDGRAVQSKSTADREDFDLGLDRFLQEARTLASFTHRNIVRVRDCFEVNDTAYIVMDYEGGEPLDILLQGRRTLTEAQLDRVLLPVVDGLRIVHAAGFLHRDIKPANIFVRRSDESPVLLDFGSARQAIGRRSKSMTAFVSDGYSPPEQYERGGHHGAWTDIYALSALCYRAITGDAPIEAPRRQSQLLRMQTDPLPKLADAGREGYSPAFLEAVDWGLRVIETERPQDLEEWLKSWRTGEAVPNSAELGDAEAQHSLGDQHYLGKGRPKDARQAAIWYRKAAEQGHAGAQTSLGLLYRRGEGITKDSGQAAVWYRKAAEQGHANAQYNLGGLYLHGDGVAQDTGQAAAWYRKAAEQGHAKAQKKLSTIDFRLIFQRVFAGPSDGVSKDR